MAGNTCSICGNKLSRMDCYNLPGENDCPLCYKCVTRVRSITSQNVEPHELETFSKYLSHNAVADIPLAVEDYLKKRFIEKGRDGWFFNAEDQKAASAQAQAAKAAAQAKAQAAAQAKAQAEQQEMLMTTTPQIAGYRITAYLGIVSGETIFGMGALTSITAGFADVFGEESDRYSDKMRRARDSATAKMRSEAKGRGANAIVGIGLEHSSFGDMVGVCATGTAVVIEPEKATEA